MNNPFKSFKSDQSQIVTQKVAEIKISYGSLFKVSEQTVWQIVGKGVTSLSTIIILGFVSRSFGTTGTGIFTLALTFLAFFYLATDLGINAHVLPQMIKEIQQTTWQKLLGLRMVLSLGLIMAAGIFILLWPDQPGLFKQSALIGIGAIFGYSLYVNANAIFQAKLRYDLSIIASCASALISLLVTLIVVNFKLGVPALLLGQLLGWSASGLLALYLVKNFTSTSPLFDTSFIKTTLQGAWPISLTLLLNILYFRLDTFILAYFKTFSDVGIYNVAYQVFQSLLVLPTFIMNSYYPLLLKVSMQSREKFVNNLIISSLLMFGIALLGTFLTILFAPLMIAIVAGGSFNGSTEALRMLSLGFPAFFVSSVLMWAMVAMKKYKTVLMIYLGGLGFNVIANLIVIPSASFLGAAMVTVLSEYLILMAQVLILVTGFVKESWQKKGQSVTQPVATVTAKPQQTITT